MKRYFVLIVFLLIASLMAGCAGTPVVYYSDCTCPTGSHEEIAVNVETTAPAAEGALKTGLSIVTNVGDSKSAEGEENGEGKYDVTMVAVLVDDHGVIRDCIIDGIAGKSYTCAHINLCFGNILANKRIKDGFVVN